MSGPPAADVLVSAERPALTMTRPLEVGIVVDDLTAMVGFYVDALSCQEVRRTLVPVDVTGPLGLGGAATFVWLQTLRGERLKLIRPSAPPGSSAAPSAARAAPSAAHAVPSILSGDQRASAGALTARRGLSYLTFYVDDAREAARRLAVAGARPLSDPPMVEVPGRLLAFWADPEGNALEIVEDAGST